MAKTKSAEESKPAKEPKGAKAKPAPQGGAAAADRSAAVSSTRRAPAPADPPVVKEASVSAPARKAAAAKAKEPAAKKPKAAKAGVRPGVAAADARKASADLRADLRAFASGRPQGWGHGDWLNFLEHLRERGHDTADADAIGMALENERLAVVLEGVQGMGPKRVDALVERFRTLWSLRHADVDQIASVPGMNLSLAEKVRQAVH